MVPKEPRVDWEQRRVGKGKWEESLLTFWTPRVLGAPSTPHPTQVPAGETGALVGGGKDSGQRESELAEREAGARSVAVRGVTLRGTSVGPGSGPPRSLGRGPRTRPQFPSPRVPSRARFRVLAAAPARAFKLRRFLLGQ